MRVNKCSINISGTGLKSVAEYCVYKAGGTPPADVLIPGVTQPSAVMVLIVFLRILRTASEVDVKLLKDVRSLMSPWRRICVQSLAEWPYTVCRLSAIISGVLLPEAFIKGRDK